MIQLFYTTYISVDLAHHRICCAKAGKGGKMLFSFGFGERGLRCL